ncbi:MAG: hypothetical protein K6B70_01625 [Clostridia bacterium]|nr:hypothetical protein [Clostridia bacterium]
MIKTSLTNPAISTYYRKQVDACWYDKVTCTTSSTSKQIQSDVIAASYEFLTTLNSTNLLQALKIAKSTNLKFEHNIISCDEFIEAPDSKASLRLLIKFSDDKEKIAVKCFIRRKSKPSHSLTRDSNPLKSGIPNLHKAIIKLEDDYFQL